MHEQAVAYFRGLQDRVCAALERADGTAAFREDAWDRPGGGGGRTPCGAHAAVADHAVMKKECDDYFFLKHRKEARGVGGIFFDYQDATEATFAFVRDAGDAFLDAYLPVVERRKGLGWTSDQRFFQEV